jgi:glycosyltransferase involved in cell wall biosynthesis
MNNNCHLETLQMTDLILVGSKEHQKALAQYTNTPCVQIRALPDFEKYPYLPFNQKINDPLIISWQQSCADGYVKDLLSIAQYLVELKKKYDFRLRLYGWHLGIGYPDLRTLVIKSLPFSELIAYVPLSRYFSEIVPEISQSDIFVVPYIAHHSRQGKGGFGTKRMMMLGVPVIGSSVGPNLEIIEDGVTGYLAKNEREWREKLERLLLESNLRQKFSENARALMEKDYSYDNCLKIFINAIKPYLR